MLIKSMQEQTETLIGVTGEGAFWGHFVGHWETGVNRFKTGD